MCFVTVGSGRITEVKEQPFSLSYQIQVPAAAGRALWSQAIKKS